MLNDVPNDFDIAFGEHADYVVDTRPLCQGMPFILTDSAHPRLILKHASHFMVLDREANIPACNTLGYGYYRNDTRHLSQLEITLDDVSLSLLSFDISKGYAGSFLYTNPQTARLLQQKLMVQRQIALSDVVCQRLVLENFSSENIEVELCIKCQSDFADMFEVRGLNRQQRGLRMLPTSDSDGTCLYLAYEGLEGSLFETIINFCGRKPDSLVDGEARYHLNLPVRTPWELETVIYTRDKLYAPVSKSVQIDFQSQLTTVDDQFLRWRSSGAQVTTQHEIVNFSIERGLRDLFILRQPTPKGQGLAAGVPWYCAVFGRDTAITALQMLPYYPDLARECIEILAAYQGAKKDQFRAERPGKIMHELRLGELARLNTIPHTPYYGTVDATALWVILVARYLSWTGDESFAGKIWPNVKLALKWLESASAAGHISYKRESPEGLENQGWKDSGDSVCHADGTLAKPPIALCEAQGYLYAAYLAIAEIACLLDQPSLAYRLRHKASVLKEKFVRDFWMEDEQFPALALDGEGNQVKVVSSNAGHCLWSGILDGEMAEQVADRMLSFDMDSGWGLRTLSARVSYFNPMSYHNGSVWPHDNAIIIEGLRKIGRIRDGHRVMNSMVAVAKNQHDFRMPELFCGFERSHWSKPIEYPVSCSPQAWAAGSIFQMLSACLNFQPDARNRILRILDPCLPDWLHRVVIRGLKIGQAELDLSFETASGQTFCQVLKKTGPLRVIIET